MQTPKRLIVDIDKSLHRKLKEFAARNDTTIRSVVLHGLAVILQEGEKDEAVRDR